MFGWIRRIVRYFKRRIRWIRTPAALKAHIVAHEAGHAFAAYCLEAVEEVLEVCVLPTEEVGGYTLTSHRGSGFATGAEIVEHMIVNMAGMAGERLLVGAVSEGAQTDIVHVIAYWLMLQTGAPQDEAERRAYAIASDLFGDDPLRRFNAEFLVGPMLAELYAAAQSLLASRIDGLRRLAKALRRRKILRHRDLERILGPRVYVGIDFVADPEDPP